MIFYYLFQLRDRHFKKKAGYLELSYTDPRKYLSELFFKVLTRYLQNIPLNYRGKITFPDKTLANFLK